MQTVPGQQRRSVDIAELKSRAEELVAEVEASGEPIEVSANGRIVAEIRPVSAPEVQQKPRTWTAEEKAAWLRSWEELAAEIGKKWPKGVSAQDVIDDIRGPW